MNTQYGIEITLESLWCSVDNPQRRVVLRENPKAGMMMSS